MKKWIIFFLLGPLFPVPAAAITPVGGATPNAYMVENTSGTSTAGSFCYDFQTKPTCSARITNLTATISSASIPSGSTFYIQNTSTPTTATQIFNVSSGAVTGLLNVSSLTINAAIIQGGTGGAAGQALTSNGAGVAPTWQASGASLLTSTNTWTGSNTYFNPVTVNSSVTVSGAIGSGGQVSGNNFNSTGSTPPNNGFTTSAANTVTFYTATTPALVLTSSQTVTIPIAVTVATATVTQLVNQINFYRRPVLVYNSGTVVDMQSGLSGTASVVTILFPDGQTRNDSSSARTSANVAQVANYYSGTNQSGLFSGTVVNNTWYEIYAVKGSNSSNAIVAVATTTLPTQANYTLLNSTFGVNGWVPIGLVVYGDSDATANAIPSFTMAGNMTLFNNSNTNTIGIGMPGVVVSSSPNITSSTWTYVAGSSATTIPSTITQVLFVAGAGAGGTGATSLTTRSGNPKYQSGTENITNRTVWSSWMSASQGASLLGAAATTKAILVGGFIDGTLGVGSNPQL